MLLIALALRLFFVLDCPHVAGDSPLYESFARNLLNFGTYSHLEARDASAPRPTLIRVPGYPLLLAATFAVAGQSNETAVRVVQAFLDTFTCLLVALIGFEISTGDERRRRRVAQWALLLSALCPFCANYSATILTEVPAIFLWTAATLFGLRALKRPGAARNWFYCGLITGGATLFRPESGILVVIFAFVLVIKQAFQHTGGWKPVFFSGMLLGTGLLLILIPWTVRNAVTIRTFEFLAPTYAQDQDETVTLGYYDWCKTWLWTYRDVSRYLFPLETENLPTGPLPSGSVDGNTQREMVLKMIEHHNQEGNYLDPASDKKFGSIAARNRRGHPLRYYLELPFLRSVAMWFTPRVEILGLEGWLLPLWEAWENDPADFSCTLFLFFVNVAYAVLGICGMISILRRSRSFEDSEFVGCFALVTIIILRTLFFAYFAFPEPRYVLETYPALMVLGAFAFTSKARRLEGCH